MLPGMMMPPGFMGTAPASGLKVQNVFAVSLYTSAGASQTITNGLDLAGKGGLVWTKNRTNAYSHQLYDTARGAGYGLNSDSAASQGSFDATSLISFNSNGYTVGIDDNSNYSGSGVGWSFARAAKFFAVVTATADGSGVAAVSHGLGVVPGLVIAKSYSSVRDWFVYHKDVGTSQYLKLNATSAPTNIAIFSGVTSTSFTCSGFSPGESTVFYLFAHDPDTTNGIIQCGSFTTNASATATITLGWEPQFVLVKRTDSTSPWYILDTSRGWDGTSDLYLSCESSSAEANGGNLGVHNSTGFTNKGMFVSANAIYMAIRKGPM